MKASVHLAVSLIIAAAIYPFFGLHALFAIAGGFLIDVDHYLWYIYRFRKLSLIACYRHYMKFMGNPNQKSEFGTLLIFHTIEFLVAAAVLSFFFGFILAFTIGLLSHYVLDLVYLYFVPKKFIVNHSILHWILTAKFKNFK